MSSADFDKAAKDLLAMDAAVRAALPKAAAAGAAPIRDEAEVRAPKGETLRLSESIVLEAVGQTAHSATHAVKVLAYYGYFQEYGTSKMAAHPFLRPAAEAKKQEAAEAMTGVINEALRLARG